MQPGHTSYESFFQCEFEGYDVLVVEVSCGGHGVATAVSRGHQQPELVGVGRPHAGSREVAGSGTVSRVPMLFGERTLH